MHIVRFSEGLGNQLFQYAFYLKLKEIYPDDKVYADVSFYETNNRHGGYKLGSLTEIDYIKPTKEMNCVTVYEKDYSSTEIKSGKNYYYDGCWFSPSYYPSDMTEMYKIFDTARLSGKNREYLDMMDGANSVSLHVRRGDFLYSSIQCNIANRTYYQNAIDYFCKNLQDPTFFVFSNDMPWSKKELDFGGAATVFVEGNDPGGLGAFFDMLLMSRCRVNIMSNSSFSWFSGLMNRREDKIAAEPPYSFNAAEQSVSKSENHIVIPNTKKFFGEGDDPFFSVIATPAEVETADSAFIVSALNQSYADFELLICESALSEKTCDRSVYEAAGNDPRVRKFSFGAGMSPCEAKYELAKHARGKYILFPDVYDYLADDTLEVLFGELSVSDTELLEFEYIKNTDVPYSELKTGNAADALRPGALFGVGNMCFSAELIKRVISAVPPIRCGVFEDRYLHLACVLAAKSYKFLPRELYQWEQGNKYEDCIIEPISKKKPLRLRRGLKNKEKAMKALVKKYSPEDKKLMRRALDREKHILRAKYARQFKGMLNRIFKK